jgi:hypothetical protein
MYEKALKINPIHILTLCCYADLLSASINPLRESHTTPVREGGQMQEGVVHVIVHVDIEIEP